MMMSEHFFAHAPVALRRLRALPARQAVKRARARAEIRGDGHRTLMEPAGPRHTSARRRALTDKIDSRRSVLALPAEGFF